MTLRDILYRPETQTRNLDEINALLPQLTSGEKTIGELAVTVEVSSPKGLDGERINQYIVQIARHRLAISLTGNDSEGAPKIFKLVIRYFNDEERQDPNYREEFHSTEEILGALGGCDINDIATILRKFCADPSGSESASAKASSDARNEVRDSTIKAIEYILTGGTRSR